MRRHPPPANRRLAAWTGVAALVLAIAPRPARAQTPRKDGDEMARRIEAVPVDRAPEIDGSLDDPVWREARWVSDFTQKEPDQGAPPTVATEIAFVYDGNALYVGARMRSDDPAQIGALMTRRDEAGNAERLVVSLDTYHDRRTAYTFAVTAAGVRLDWYNPSDHEYDRDDTFDPVWQARTRVEADGWTAEMRIPFSQLRFSSARKQVWGVNVDRYIPALNEDVYWVVVPRDESGWASRFGELVGIRDVRPSRRIELVPYLASEATFTSAGLVDREDPFNDGSMLATRTGVDFKMGLGPNLTLDATINPDFGQVEADPAEVNLSAFETFFDERRPFFTEGRQMLVGNGPSYYYSRRIGASPHGETEADFADVPGTTTILGAAKVTGQLASGWSVGGMTAVTAREEARTFDLATDAFGVTAVEPRTGYGALRLQRQFGPNASTLGVTLTAVDRGPVAASTLLADRAFAGGVDWNRRFEGGRYELLGHVGFSRVSGDTAALRRIQRSSTHYFQRPDQGHVEVDPLRTALSGWSAAVRGGKRSGSWLWNGGVWADSPGFEINDLGQLGRADDIAQWASAQYQETDPGPFLRRWNVGVFTNNNWNFDGVRRYGNVGMFGNWTAKNFWNGFFEHGRDLPVMDDVATRGGPLMRSRAAWWLGMGVFTNEAATTRWGLRALTTSDARGGWSWRVDPELHVQATDRLTLSFTPRYIRTRGSRQYVDTFGDGPAATFGSRYVFAWIDRSEVATPVRASYSFSPDMSVELYAEPFAASGRYFGFGELAAARTDELRTYGEEGTSIVRQQDGDYRVTDGASSFTISDPDFDVLSFRSNLVLRWEWRPGSTFFLVWQQNRSAGDAAGRLVSPGRLLDAFSAAGDNVLAMKFTYWVPF